MNERAIEYLSPRKDSRTGILTNHTGFGWKQDYHFKSLRSFLNIKRVFIPEHGLFAELQDQVSGKGLTYFNETMEFWNLYGDSEDSLVPPDEKLTDLDLVVIDIRDVGARYYTFLTTAFYIMQKLSSLKLRNLSVPEILVLNSPNPIGTKVEGSPLKPGYESFVGVVGVLHRHGLSPGGLLSFYNDFYNLKLNMSIVPPGIFHPEKYDVYGWIPPSPNIPSITTCFVYPGQCLLEGTNLSEGRGTTRPFEIFGAPFLDYENERLRKKLEAISNGSYYLRPLRFKPTFHKYKDELCGGYQLHILDESRFHSLYFSLHLLKVLMDEYPKEFQFLKGVYEFRSDRPAIELLVGDPFLLDYIYGQSTDKQVLEYMESEEGKWRNLVYKFS